MHKQLLEKEFFPWGGLPYPFEHAKLGRELITKGNIEDAQKMATFQQATLDHKLKPILSLFRQDRGYSQAELEEANSSFFEAAGIAMNPTYQYVDPTLGIVARRDAEHAMICLGSGCKSGMGAYFAGDSAVLNFGPQLTPLGDCSGFGLAGRAQNVKAEETFLSYQCRLAAPHNRDTGFPWLEDSGYAGAWIESACNIESDQMKVECQLEGFRPHTDFLFTFFVKAEACLVAGSHKLNPRSLDRYQGPPQTVVCNDVLITPEQGFHSMKVLPLAGDESYWSADFMIALTLSNHKFLCSIGRA